MLYADHIAARGGELFRLVCEQDLEGMVAKRRDGLYAPEATDLAQDQEPAVLTSRVTAGAVRVSAWRQGRESAAHVGEELAQNDINGLLAAGDGYFYFWSGEAAGWLDRTVQVERVNDLSLEEWVARFHALRRKNQQILAAVKPGQQAAGGVKPLGHRRSGRDQAGPRPRYGCVSRRLPAVR